MVMPRVARPTRSVCWPLPVDFSADWPTTDCGAPAAGNRCAAAAAAAAVVGSSGGGGSSSSSASSGSHPKVWVEVVSGAAGGAPGAVRAQAQRVAAVAHGGRAFGGFGALPIWGGGGGGGGGRRAQGRGAFSGEQSGSADTVLQSGPPSQTTDCMRAWFPTWRRNPVCCACGRCTYLGDDAGGAPLGHARVVAQLAAGDARHCRRGRGGGAAAVRQARRRACGRQAASVRQTGGACAACGGECVASSGGDGS